MMAVIYSIFSFAFMASRGFPISAKNVFCTSSSSITGYDVKDVPAFFRKSTSSFAISFILETILDTSSIALNEYSL